MNRPVRLVIVLVIATSLAGLAGGWLGVRIASDRPAADDSLDRLLHHELALSATQNERIMALEATFHARRRGLEAELRAANLDLARAIASEHVYGPAAERAVARFHTAMGQLQALTIIHILAMRQVLTPPQAARFDKTVTQSLTAPAP